jgi:hypothetical protein
MSGFGGASLPISHFFALFLIGDKSFIGHVRGPRVIQIAPGKPVRESAVGCSREAQAPSLRGPAQLRYQWGRVLLQRTPQHSSDEKAGPRRPGVVFRAEENTFGSFR